MFKIGDIVEITEESDATGMLDFKMGKGYEVELYAGGMVSVVSESGKTGWYHKNHFKLKEDTIVEKKECLFKEGQVVWDVAFGKGIVRAITNRNDPDRPITVGFNGDLLHYTEDGAYSKQRYRTLFFSEPKIEAATEPLCGTESLFTQGDSVLCRVFGQGTVLSISEEDDEVHVEFKDGGTRTYTLGGKLYDLFPDEVVTLSIVKQAFTPTLKHCDAVFAVHDSGHVDKFVILQEYEDEIHLRSGEILGKRSWAFYRLGEKIDFK